MIPRVVFALRELKPQGYIIQTTLITIKVKQIIVSKLTVITLMSYMVITDHSLVS